MVPEVLMVRLFLSMAVPGVVDQVPVPFNMMLVVPVMGPLRLLLSPTTRLPAALIVELLMVRVLLSLDSRVVVPLTVRLLARVMVIGVGDMPAKATLFHVMPVVLSGADAPTFSVEPVVTTVPAVYVRVPV